MEERIWTLYHGGELVADLVVTDGDFPWLYARVEPRPGFAAVRPLFDAELRLLHDESHDWDDAYEAIRTAVTLRYPEGGDVPEFLLHIDGDEAWWRWSDTPFDDEP